MPQLVKKRRSGWAILVVSAMVASILAIGAAPVAATVQEADAQATWTACLGPAKVGADFTDVTMGNTHYDNINCLRYYGITTGKTADTFDPNASVTRSQMALFLTRMAGVADVALDDDSSAGFTDLGATGADRMDAVNRLANAGIMTGRTATTFEPDAQVTRADMALHLFAFLDLALDEIFIDQLPKSVDGDDAGHIELNDFDGDGNGQRVDDYFGDARQTVPAHVDNVIGAIYELGVTTGTNGRVGESGTFKPEANVTRAQMASFIMRTLGHTNVRPEGLTAQQTYTETQVSLRSADFEPVQNERVEVFESSFAEDAFDRSRRCVDRFVYVNDENPSFEPCQIDGGDTRTDIYGNAILKPGLLGGRAVIVCIAGTPYAGETLNTYRLEAAGIDDPAYDYKLWAWTGVFGDTVGSDTELFEAVPANQLDERTRAVTAVFSGGTHHPAVRMGSTLVYEIQLVDDMGRPVGPNPAGDVDSDQDYMVTITKQRNVLTLNNATPPVLVPATVQPRPTVSVTQMTPDNDGNIRIVITNPDSNIASNSADVTVMVEVARAEKNNLRFVNTIPGGTPKLQAPSQIAAPFDAVREIGSDAPPEMFSDDVPRATSIGRTQFTWRELSRINRNSIPVNVLDQYGNPFGEASIRATSDMPGTPAFDIRSSDRGGRIYFSYEYPGVAAEESVTLDDIPLMVNPSNPTGPRVDGPDGPLSPEVAHVYWADLGPAGDGPASMLLLADPSSSALIVNTAPNVGDPTLPEAYLFGADDTFMVGADDTVLSLEQFVEVLTVANSSDPRIAEAGWMLEWAGFNRGRPTDGASWNVKGLTCQPPPGADREPALAN